MKRYRLLLALPLLVGCASQKWQAVQTVPAAEQEPAELDRAAHWIRNSAEYQALVRQAYNVASDHLRELVVDKEKGTWAVALDADETIIDNTDYEKELTTARQQSTQERWDGWVARRAAPPLPGAVDFLELVHELGGYITVVTNRIDEHCPDTRANFRAFDIPFDVILCRQETRRKEPRWERVKNGTASKDLPPLEIVMWIGDNIRDFPDLDQDLRSESAESFGAFGRRYFAMPNPVYGSWMDNPQD